MEKWKSKKQIDNEKDELIKELKKTIIEKDQTLQLLQPDVISRFFKQKAKEHGVNELNMFIENSGTHISLCVFSEFDSRVLEERINGL